MIVRKTIKNCSLKRILNEDTKTTEIKHCNNNIVHMD